MLTQDDARKIAAKLKAEITPGRKHDIAVFRHDGRYIAQFGIQRASKDKPHDYVPRQLFMTAKQGREFLECSLSLVAYVEILRSKSPSPLG
jgi:predicted amidohydrolase